VCIGLRARQSLHNNNDDHGKIVMVVSDEQNVCINPHVAGIDNSVGDDEPPVFNTTIARVVTMEHSPISSPLDQTLVEENVVPSSVPTWHGSGTRQGGCSRWVMPPALLPPLDHPSSTTATATSARSLGTVSTLTTPGGMFDSYTLEGDDDTLVGTEQDFHMYLLREDPRFAHHVHAIGCSDLFRMFPKRILRLKCKRRELRSTKKLTDRLHKYRSMSA
jgi:hypothetical protein